MDDAKTVRLEKEAVEEAQSANKLKSFFGFGSDEEWEAALAEAQRKNPNSMQAAVDQHKAWDRDNRGSKRRKRR